MERRGNKWKLLHQSDKEPRCMSLETVRQYWTAGGERFTEPCLDTHVKSIMEVGSSEDVAREIRSLWKLLRQTHEGLKARTRSRDSCWVWGSHDSDYGECYNLGCDTVKSGRGLQTFRRKQRALLAWITLRPWTLMNYAPPKRRWTSPRLHSVTSRKILFFNRRLSGKCLAVHTKHWSH
jgi:hypothetical protein